MASTFTQLYTHFIFSTKHRLPQIAPRIEAKLYPYISGICANLKCRLVRGGGFTDHSHLLVRRHPTVCESDLMRTIKAGTSGWIRDSMGTPEFAWQDGYGAFSVSTSSLDDVAAYIDRQHEHHASVDFKSEFIAFLERHGIEYDPRGVFD